MRYLRFLLELIKVNPVKIIVLGLVFLLIIPYNYCKDFTIEYSVEKTFISSNNKFCYVTGKDDSYQVLVFDKKQQQDGKVISYQQTNPFRILSLAAIIALLVSLLVVTFLGWNEKPGWNINRCIVNACLSEVTCEFEDNKYFVQFEGRLIYKSDYNRFSKVR